MDKDIISRITEEKAVEVCMPDDEDIARAMRKGLAWTQQDSEYAAREIRRSVRHIAASANLLSTEHLLLSLDAMPRLAGTKGAPKMNNLLQDLVDRGFQAARYPGMNPMFITNADFESVKKIVRKYYL